MAGGTKEAQRSAAPKAEITQIYKKSQEIDVYCTTKCTTKWMKLITERQTQLQQADILYVQRWSSRELVSMKCEDVPEVVTVDVG